jgi:hypothetical protein
MLSDIDVDGDQDVPMGYDNSGPISKLSTNDGTGDFAGS